MNYDTNIIIYLVLAIVAASAALLYALSLHRSIKSEKITIPIILKT